MRNFITLFKRDIKNCLNKRLVIMLAAMILFQFWFILGSDSAEQVKATGMMHYMAVVFSFNFFGSIVALTLNHDGLSRERKSKFLDLILTSNIDKKMVYSSKILASFVISFIFAAVYVLVLALIYITMSGSFNIGFMTFRYVLPLTAFLSIFSLMGLMFSVVFRSSNTSLITSIIIGGIVMPRLFIMIVDSIGNMLGMNAKATEILYMLSPAIIMNYLNGYSEITYVCWALLLLIIYLTIVIITGMRAFIIQDELNYGE